MWALGTELRTSTLVGEIFTSQAILLAQDSCLERHDCIDLKKKIKHKISLGSAVIIAVAAVFDKSFIS